MVTIRHSAPADIPAVRELFREYAGSLGFPLCFDHFDEELANLPGEYLPPTGRLLLAECDGALAGCVALRPNAEGVCEMKRLYVRPAFRAQKIGRVLVDEILAEARAAGYHRMRLDSVVGVMDTAIALYRHLGFQEIPPYKNNPVPGAVYFELDLSTVRAHPFGAVPGF